MRLTSTRHADVTATKAVAPFLSREWALSAIAVGLLAIFVLDWSTGTAPVQHLYYLPIILAAVRFGLRGGIAGSIAAIVLYHLANPQLLSLRHQEADLLQIVLFAAVGPVVARLTHDARRLHQLAMTDDLTGLHNLRSFERRLTAMIREARGMRYEIVLLVLDLDRLKSLNDAHGHLAGAEAVRTVGQLIAAGVPAEAVACRYGGDEFVVALPRTTRGRAREIAEGLRHAVQAAAPMLAGIQFPAGSLSISIGVAGRTFEANATERNGQAGEALFRQADRALYTAKGHGRNRVHVA
ncbi:MAG TPA: GGDEF domain-containing protein [Candidatus Nitrosotalea sp.]|nr:GGDEF domain-containing protein [Candidatus Nitrosotalea sp.]